MAKFSKGMNLKQAFINNFWLKVISLIIAITIWLYMSGEITKGISV